MLSKPHVHSDDTGSLKTGRDSIFFQWSRWVVFLFVDEGGNSSFLKEPLTIFNKKDEFDETASLSPYDYLKV